MAGTKGLFPRTGVPNPCYKCIDRTEDCHASCDRHATFVQRRKAEREMIAQQRRDITGADEYFINQAEKSKRIRMNKNRK